jgi:hypothetical protein
MLIRRSIFLPAAALSVGSYGSKQKLFTMVTTVVVNFSPYSKTKRLPGPITARAPVVASRPPARPVARDRAGRWVGKKFFSPPTHPTRASTKAPACKSCRKRHLLGARLAEITRGVVEIPILGLVLVEQELLILGEVLLGGELVAERLQLASLSTHPEHSPFVGAA